MKIGLETIAITAIAIIAATLSGCCNTGTCGGRPGLFGSVNGARIAAPPTGTIQYPAQVASLPDPYYGRSAVGQPTPATTPGNGVQAGSNNQGWRPLGTTAQTTNPISYNPTSYNIQTAPRNTIPANNLQVATSTSAIQPQPNSQMNSPVFAQPSNQLPTTTPGQNQTPQIASATVSGGMPLNDATRVAATPAIPNQGNATGTFNRTWEYVARPNATTHTQGNPNQYVQNPNQYATQPIYVNGSVVSSNSTFTGPRPNSYAYPNGTPNGYPAGYQNGYPTSVVADGWRQRDMPR